MILWLSPGGSYFNPRAYVRHDISFLSRFSFEAFQSTCLREARPAAGQRRMKQAYFNPRAYVRHDIIPDEHADAAQISIHVPT